MMVLRLCSHYASVPTLHGAQQVFTYLFHASLYEPFIDRHIIFPHLRGPCIQHRRHRGKFWLCLNSRTILWCGGVVAAVRCSYQLPFVNAVLYATYLSVASEVSWTLCGIILSQIEAGGGNSGRESSREMLMGFIETESSEYQNKQTS
jgi:hypothetical protein